MANGKLNNILLVVSIVLISQFAFTLGVQNEDTLTTERYDNDNKYLHYPSLIEVMEYINELKTELTKDRLKMSAMDKALNEYRARISTLENTAVKDKKTINDLRTDMDNLYEECKSSDKEKKVFETHEQDIKNDSAIENKIETQTQMRISDSAGPHRRPIRTVHGQGRSNKRVAEPEPGTKGVAFHASLSSLIDSPPNGYLMRFDKVLTNIGNAYDEHTGVFTCPQTGTYFITWSFHIERYWGSALLYKNGNKIATATSGNERTYQEEGSGNTVVHLDLGDTLSVHAYNPSSIDFNMPASFGGFSIL